MVMKTVAIIGRPNVGKSSLFNSFVGERDAIISDVSGTTRDVKRRVVNLFGTQIELWDTGGIEDRDELFDAVKERSLRAAAEADILLFMADAKNPANEEDRRLFIELAKLHKPFALVINKVDNDKLKESAWDYASFGASIMFTISVSHSRGVLDLVDWIKEHGVDDEEDTNFLVEDDDFSLEDALEFEEAEEEESTEIRVAIIGRPNVGKSQLLNSIVGHARSVVSPVAGTTIDPVDETIEYQDKKITFVDTAGIRKRSRIVGIETWALDRSEKVLEIADVAILTLDASEPFIQLDERVAGFIDKHKTACIIAINKWDKPLETFEKTLAEVREKFKFLSFAPTIAVSGLTKRGVTKLLDEVLKVYESYSRKIPTKKLNDLIDEAGKRHPIPSDHGRIVRIKFAAQYATKPPKISLVMNVPSLHFSYKRYLINRLREEFDFSGSPIIINTNRRGEREEENED
jgi:GTP-binding protein